jgi:chemotaxis protein MotB
MKKIATLFIVLTLLMTSCVSKKKYVALEQDLMNTKGNLQKTTVEKEALEAKIAKIRKRVEDYNSKINSLNETKNSLNQALTNEKNDKLVIVDNNTVVMSKNIKDKLAKTLAKMSPDELVNAKTLKDSINLAISYNLKKTINDNNLSDDIDVNIDKTVVMISVSDKMLFNSGSYRVSKNANELLQKLADIINSEPSMDVIIEGHTDSRTISTPVIQDNWDLSTKRATSIVRILQKKYNVDPARLIASGRSSYVPIADNETKEGRARNRRTNIIILPNLNKFFALVADEEKIDLN